MLLFRRHGDSKRAKRLAASKVCVWWPPRRSLRRETADNIFREANLSFSAPIGDTGLFEIRLPVVIMPKMAHFVLAALSSACLWFFVEQLPPLTDFRERESHQYYPAIYLPLLSPPFAIFFLSSYFPDFSVKCQARCVISPLLRYRLLCFQPHFTELIATHSRKHIKIRSNAKLSPPYLRIISNTIVCLLLVPWNRPYRMHNGRTY